MPFCQSFTEEHALMFFLRILAICFPIPVAYWSRPPVGDKNQ